MSTPTKKKRISPDRQYLLENGWRETRRAKQGNRTRVFWQFGADEREYDQPGAIYHQDQLERRKKMNTPVDRDKTVTLTESDIETLGALLDIAFDVESEVCPEDINSGDREELAKLYESFGQLGECIEGEKERWDKWAQFVRTGVRPDTEEGSEN